VLSVLGWWFVGCPVGGRLIPVLAAVEIALPVPLQLVCWNWLCRCWRLMRLMKLMKHCCWWGKVAQGEAGVRGFSRQLALVQRLGVSGGCL